MYIAAGQRQLTSIERVPSDRLVTGEWPTRTLIVLSDIVSLSLSSALGFWIVAMVQHGLFPPGKYLPIQFLLSLVGLALFGLYPGIAIHPVPELKRTLSAVTLVYLATAASAASSGRATTSQELALLVCGLVSGPLVILFRALVRGVFSSAAWWGVPAVLITTHQGGADVYKILNRNRAIGLRIVAVLQDSDRWNVGPNEAGDSMLTGHIELAPYLAASHKIAHAIVALDSLSSTHVLPIIERYAGKYRHVHLMPDTGLLASISVYAKDLGGLLSLELDQVLLHSLPQTFKRCFDTLVGLVLAILLSPLLVAIYLAVRFTSPGPVFYGSKRIGMNGEIFTAWKFRSMVMDSDRVLKAYLEKNPAQRESWEKHLKMKNDPRVTSIGRLLRRTSLDELPQLWNVLTGEMSLVGPRPILPHEIERYRGGLALYAKVRPGVTGFWQVSGRNDTSFEQRRIFDEYYVRNWSPWLDLYILGRTVGTVLCARGSWV